MSPTIGTILVLIGTILCAIALVFSRTREPRGITVSTILSLGATLIGVGILIGAPALHAVH